MSPLTHKLSASTVYLLVIIYVSMVALTAANILYTNHVAQQSERRWCGVLAVYHQAYADNPPPTTQAGKDIKTQLERLYTDFGCATVPKP